jgi:hypothetical protein
MNWFERMQQEDKAQHIICAFLVVVLLSGLMPAWQAYLAVFLAGMVKEAWDYYVGTGFCWYDIAANVIGIAFSGLCVLGLG